MRVERVYDWSVDNGLRERDPQSQDPSIRPPDTVRIGHISDTHLGKGEPGARRAEMRHWLETLEGLDTEVITHSGDLVEDPADREVVDGAFAVIDERDVPVVGVPGNHDVKTPGEGGLITERWGPFPRVEEIRSVEFLLLDSMAWPPAGERSQREHDAAEETGFYSRGGVGPDQCRELRELLDESADKPRVVVVHHHLRQPVPPKPWYEEHADLMAPMVDADRVMQWARDVGAQLIVHGHRHQYTTPYHPFAELVLINGGSCTREQSPKRARIIDMADDGGAMRIWELAR